MRKHNYVEYGDRMVTTTIEGVLEEKCFARSKEEIRKLNSMEIEYRWKSNDSDDLLSLFIVRDGSCLWFPSWNVEQVYCLMIEDFTLQHPLL